MAQFKKGEGGRPKGKANKITTDLRQWINSFIDDNREQIKEDWQQLEPKDRIILFEKLLKYSLPTLQATSITTSNEVPAVDLSILPIEVLQQLLNNK